MILEKSGMAGVEWTQVTQEKNLW